MFGLDSDDEIDPEDYYGHEYFDDEDFPFHGHQYLDMLDLVNALGSSDNSGEDIYDDEALSINSSSLPVEELRGMKRCKEICAKQNEDRKEGLFCDATISIENKTFPVHKLVLKASSSYFSAMFAGSFAEKDGKVVEIRGVSPEVFSRILEYMYGGEINLSFENVKEIYMAADMLCVDSLIADCKRYIEENWLTTDFAEVHELANRLELTDTGEAIIKFAKNYLNYTDLTKEKGGFLNWTYEFLVSVLEGRKGTKLKNESNVGYHLLKWSFEKPEIRLPEKSLELFSHVKFHLITELDFRKLVENIHSHKSLIDEDQMNSFIEAIKDLNSKAHLSIADSNVKLISFSGTENVNISVFNSSSWEWESKKTKIISQKNVFLVKDEEIYIFDKKGGDKLDLKTQRTTKLPDFPERRLHSTFCMLGDTVYVTGGIQDGTGKRLGEILELRPSAEGWVKSINWFKNKCNASSISFNNNIYIIGGAFLLDQSNGGGRAECFVYNTLTRYFQKIGDLPYPISNPKLAIHNGVLYVFCSDNARKLPVRIDLSRLKIVPLSDEIYLDYTYPILDICAVDEGIIIAYTCDNSILLVLLKIMGTCCTELLGFVPMPNLPIESLKLVWNTCET